MRDRLEELEKLAKLAKKRGDVELVRMIKDVLLGIQKLQQIADTAHDVLKSFDVEKLYEYNEKDEPLTDERLLACRIRRLDRDIDNYNDFCNGEEKGSR